MPSLNSTSTPLKLKSLSFGEVLLAEVCKICVPFKKISFFKAFIYAVDVLSVIPAFDAVALPRSDPQRAIPRSY